MTYRITYDFKDEKLRLTYSDIEIIITTGYGDVSLPCKIEKK
jgi:hypothetical protein